MRYLNEQGIEKQKTKNKTQDLLWSSRKPVESIIPQDIKELEEQTSELEQQGINAGREGSQGEQLLPS